MEPTEEQLQEIETNAYLYMTRQETALIVGLDPAIDLKDDTSIAGIAFLRGSLKRKAQFNKNITTLSDQLSSPAQAIELKLAANKLLNDKKS